MPSTVASSHGRPAICKASGRPERLNPMHWDRAGPPETFQGVVKDAFCQKFAVRQAPNGGAGAGAVGVTSAW